MYTTIDKVKDELIGTNVYKGAATDQTINRYIRTVSRRIDTYKFDFEPVYDVKKFTATRQNVNSYDSVFTFKKFLLEPLTITSNGVNLVYGTDVLNYPDDNEFPIQQLRLANPTSGPVRNWYPYQNVANCGQVFESIVITGFWGMRQYYSSDGFIASGQTSPVMTDSQTTIITSGAWGADAFGASPLFSAGNLIRIDDELMDIIAADATSMTLTLRRGIRGSTAAAHTVGSTILLWYPEDDVVQEATRQVALLYSRRGAFQQTTISPDGVTVSYPSDLLASLRAMIQRFDTI